MKARILALFILAAILVLALQSFVNAPVFTFGSPFGYAGDPAGGNFNCKSCHSGPAPVTNKPGWITSNIPGTGYVPGTTYTITASATAAGHSKIGFELTPQNPSGTFLGTLANINTETQLYFDSTQPRISHTTSSTTGTGSRSWAFTWTAPTTGSGAVTFYGMFNVTNNNGGGQGDTIYSCKTTVTENTSVGITSLIGPANGVEVVPSLVTDQFQVKFGLSGPELVEIALIDLQGRASILMPATPYTQGNFTESFSVGGKYSGGPCFVKINIGKRASVHKIYLGN